MLRELGRVLMPGGALLLATHEGTGEFVAEATRPSGARCTRVRSLSAALASEGFKVGEIRARDPLPHERQSGRVYVTATAGADRPVG